MSCIAIAMIFKTAYLSVFYQIVMLKKFIIYLNDFKYICYKLYIDLWLCFRLIFNQITST